MDRSVRASRVGLGVGLGVVAGLALSLGFVPGLRGQAAFPAVFVANNGNLEGSVTSYRVEDDGRVSFLQELVLGARASGEPDDPGTNAYAIDLSPKGEFLAISHTTAATVVERISIVRVGADGTLSLFANFETPNSPLKLRWVSDSLLAVTRTNSGGTNSVILYRFDPASSPARLVHLDTENTGGFTSDLAVSPSGQFVVCNDSPLGGSRRILSFEVVGDTLAPRDTRSIVGSYAIGMGFSAQGSRLYVCGGALTPYVVHGFDFGDTAGSGLFTPHAAAPYTTTGSSPKQAVASPDGRFLYAGHGTDATIQLLEIDPASGALVRTALAYDVGIQGSLGDIESAIIAGRPMLFFTDKETYDGTGRGLFSAEINPDGTLRIISERVDSQGISPNDAVVWAPSSEPDCPADLDDGTFTGTPDGGVTIDDLLFFVDRFGAGDLAADLDDGTGNGSPDGGVTIDDLLFFLARFEMGC